MKIGLISCTKKKKQGKMPAKELYQASPLFFYGYKYLKEVLKVDKLFILSAKYNVLNEDDIIETYEQR